MKLLKQKDDLTVMFVCANDKSKEIYEKYISGIDKLGKIKFKSCYVVRSDYELELYSRIHQQFDVAILFNVDIEYQPDYDDETEMKFYHHYMNAPLSGLYNISSVAWNIPQELGDKIMFTWHSQVWLDLEQEAHREVFQERLASIVLDCDHFYRNIAEHTVIPLFKRFDLNGDLTIDISELIKMLRELGSDASSY